jgi:single-stranded DNA-binding protein
VNAFIHDVFQRKSFITMAKITIRGRFSKAGVLAHTPNQNKPFVSLSLAENLKNAAGERVATWYDATGWNQAAIDQMLAAKPADYIEVTGYATSKAFMRKDGTAGASISVSVQSVTILPDTRKAAPAATAAATVPAGNVEDEEVGF